MQQPLEERSEYRAVATSFVGYLIRAEGIESLRRHLGTLKAGGAQRAAHDAPPRSLGALEEDWRAALRRVSPSGLGLKAFTAKAWPYLSPYLRHECEIFVYLLFGLGFALAVPLASAHLVDQIIPRGDLNELTILLTALVAAFLLNAALTFRRSRLTQYVSESIVRRLRLDMFIRLQELPHAFYANTKTGDIVTRMTADIEAIKDVVAETFASGIYLILSVVFASFLLLRLHWLLGLIVLLLAPLFILTGHLLDKRVRPASADVQQKLSELVSSLEENIDAQPVVKAFGLQRNAIGRFEERLNQLFSSSLGLGFFLSLFRSFASLSTALTPIIVLGLGTYLIIQGQFTIGGLLAFISLMNQAVGPIGQLAELAQEFQSGSGALDRVVEFLNLRPTIVDAPGAKSLAAPQREIRFQDVSFSYSAERPTLRDLSLVVPVGSSVAFVGPTGAGKSSTVGLLLRFYDPDQGQILLDDQDIRNVTLDSLRASMAVVLQDTFVFDASIRENIAMGRLGATEEDVVAAAEAAALHDFIVDLPRGYDTVVGERGVSMSGGQRQRLAIARAIIRNPAVLILDEATSALDPQTERAIQQTLGRLGANRTTISITHRLTSAIHCDRILVLERGSLVEQGSHDELMRLGGLYRRLYDEQTSSAAVAVEGQGWISAR